MGDSQNQPFVPENGQSVSKGVSRHPSQEKQANPIVAHQAETPPNAPLVPTRRYWARYLIHLTIGFIVGLLIGSVIQLYVDMPGWSVVGAVAGFMGGIVVFMLRRDT